MTTINRMSQLLVALKQQLDSKSRLDSANKPTSEKSLAPQSATLAPMTAEQLRLRMGRELQRFNLKTPAGKKAARLTFIESVLAWDLGEEILNDEQLSSIVRDVELSMSSSDEVIEKLDELLQEVQKSNQT